MARNPLYPDALQPMEMQGNDLIGYKPTLADGWDYNAKAYNDWVAQQQADLVARGLNDPQTGWPTQAGWVDALKTYGNAMIAGTGAPKGVLAYHGSPVNFTKYDPALSGTGAMADYYAKRTGPMQNPAMYLTSNPQHAALYGDNVMPFNIAGKIKNYNAVPEIKSWAKELGYKDPQKMIDEYFDGDVYRALDGDNYFQDKQKEAAKAGINGVSIDFGNLVHSGGGPSHKPGKIYVISDPSMIQKVEAPGAPGGTAAAASDQ